MSESQVIHHSTLPLTTASITADLRTLGIQNGDILLVHSSLSSLGWVCGSAVAVIDALLESVGSQGTLCMPAHSGEKLGAFQVGKPARTAGVVRNHPCEYARIPRGRDADQGHGENCGTFPILSRDAALGSSAGLLYGKRETGGANHENPSAQSAVRHRLSARRIVSSGRKNSAARCRLRQLHELSSVGNTLE